MGWRIVVQPNNLFGRFSEIVDGFTDMNMTRDEALTCCKYNDAADPEAKVRNAEKAGSERWDEAIGIIRRLHGDEEADEAIEMGSEVFK